MVKGADCPWDQGVTKDVEIGLVDPIACNRTAAMPCICNGSSTTFEHDRRRPRAGRSPTPQRPAGSSTTPISVGNPDRRRRRLRNSDSSHTGNVDSIITGRSPTCLRSVTRRCRSTPTTVRTALPFAEVDVKHGRRGDLDEPWQYSTTGVHAARV